MCYQNFALSKNLHICFLAFQLTFLDHGFMPTQQVAIIEKK